MNITLEFCEKCAKSMELRYEVAKYSKLSVKLCKDCEIKLLKAFDEYREKVNNKEEKNE